mgnify:CR=1 FL=1
MKLSLRNLVICALLPLAAAAASAQEFKVGIVNLDRIFREANSAKAAQVKLEQEFTKREKEIADYGAQIKTLSEKLEREAPTLSESQRNTRQRQLVDQDREFQRKRREFQEDLNNRKNEELQVVIERANRVVKSLAETEKYDLIVQEAVYVNPKHDITDKVIKLLNASNSR